MLNWLEQSSLGLFVGQSDWGYAFVLSAHAVGMATLAGMIIMTNLRVVGFAPFVPIDKLGRMLDLIYIGLMINVLSGIALFCGGANRIAVVWAFWAKLLFIGLGLWTFFRAYRAAANPAASAAVNHRQMAAISIALWILAIISGRLIAYLD
jgi:hypothetical protein